MAKSTDYGLEFLLGFDGRIHYLEKGYWLKFEIKKVETSAERPHGLSYSFTLHAPGGTRLIGFDNAHRVKGKAGQYKKRSKAYDHWHRIGKGPARPYEFKDAATLIDDFFDAVEQLLGKRGVGMTVIKVEDARNRNEET